MIGPFHHTRRHDPQLHKKLPLITWMSCW